MLERLWSIFRKSRPQPAVDQGMMATFKTRYASFKELLQVNSELLQLISDIEEKLRGEDIFGMAYVRAQSSRCVFYAARMIQSLEALAGRKYPALVDVLEHIQNGIHGLLDQRQPQVKDFVLPFDRITREMIDFVGGKIANLGEVANGAHLPIPRGYAITTAAYYRIQEANDLSDSIKKVHMALDAADPQSILEVSRQLQDLFLEATIPADVVDAVTEAHHRLAEACGRPLADLRVSMRSSAIGEDSDLSFAGQYLSVLNVAPEKVVSVYRRILASLFTPRAVTYRLHRGIPAEEVAMGTACLEMVPAMASGVMYSRHPFHITEDHVIVNAVWGLGPYAVDGKVTPDAYTLSKDDPPAVLGSKIAVKPVRLAVQPDGALIEEAVSGALQRRPCLTEFHLKTLAGYAVALERHFQRPQDIEWALDSLGRLFILQSRPLQVIGRSTRQQDAGANEAIAGFPVVLSGGDVACPGAGCGPAHVVRSDEDLLSFPDGGILVAASPNPKYFVVMPKARAIVTDTGSITGHMASLAREFMVPALLNTGEATKLIAPGMEVTVDAYSGRVYAGQVPELLDIKMQKGDFMKDSPVFARLRKVADYIVPLNLIDPKSEAFHPRNCRTIHDIMRLAHEFSYRAIFEFSSLASDVGRLSFKLDVRLPLDLHIIDLGGGLTDVPAQARSVTPVQIASAPFRALLKGLLREDVAAVGPRPVNIKGFMSVMSEQMLTPTNIALERFGDKSYAIISDKYVNFSSRVGYHYSVVDAYSGLTVNKNYINFQFKGGAADDVRRGRRSRGIAKVLQALGFIVDTKADVVRARFQKHPAAAIEEALDHLGRLLQFTRQMDMLMQSEASVTMLSECFLNGDYQLCLEKLATEKETA
ncbi:MAG: PEP/pyruvate-binding domain-containing protein [Desulfobacterales bacterium]